MDGKETNKLSEGLAKELNRLAWGLASDVVISARYDGDATAYWPPSDAEVEERTADFLRSVCDMLSGAAPLDAVAASDTLQALHAEILQGTGKG